MCGIAGIYRHSGRAVPEDLLLAMAGELRHRGPDGTGLYLDGSFGMVATRLAIIDLVGGDQPLPDERARHWVVQNGEIYNHVELRRELERLGHHFATRSDTEVLAHAYARWGPECLDRLNGDFAFAVWDSLTRELVLARDRFGVRPLFVARIGDDFCFASEAKALLRHPGARRELDGAALAEFFVTWGNASGRSSFVGIRELPPGHFLRLRPNGESVEHRWWDLDFSQANTGSAGDMLEELRALLEDSVRLRLRADVPVALYASGGLDSTALAGLARRHAARRLSLFGLAFEDDRFDESRYQRLVADSLGAELHQAVVRPETTAKLLPEVVRLAERPTLRTAPAPLLHLATIVHESGTKVVLTGEGADELFGGYDIFRENKVRRFCARDPQSESRTLLYARLNEYLGADLGRIVPFLARFYGRGLLETDDPLYSHRIRFANGRRIVALLRPELVTLYGEADRSLEGLLRRLPPAFTSFGPLEQAQYLEVLTFLEGYLLHTQADRVLMGRSVEGRFPYLDYRVAELAARLPSHLRLLGLREKVGLRRAVADLVPTEIRNRKKWPFRSPIAASLLGGDERDTTLDLLRPERVAASGILDPRAVSALVAKLESTDPRSVGEADEMALAGAVSTMLLHEQFVVEPASKPAAVATKIVERVASSVEPIRHVEVAR